MSVMAPSTVSTTGGTPATNCFAMKVVSAEQHPNADALRLYTMFAPEVETVQIIANLDNVYQIDDVVAIALSGAVLKDGTKIKPSKLRGVYSYGMALGKVDVAVGTDLSEVYCQPEARAHYGAVAPSSASHRLPRQAYSLLDGRVSNYCTMFGVI